MAGKSFCGAVNDHVITESDRILEHWRGESVVNDGDEFVFLGEGHGFVNIDEAKSGIGGRFDVKNFGTRREKNFDGGEIGADLADGDAHVGENIETPTNPTLRLEIGRAHV